MSVWHLRETGWARLTIESGDQPFSLPFPLQTNSSWKSKLDSLTKIIKSSKTNLVKLFNHTNHNTQLSWLTFQTTKKRPWFVPDVMSFNSNGWKRINWFTSKGDILKRCIIPEFPFSLLLCKSALPTLLLLDCANATLSPKPNKEGAIFKPIHTSYPLSGTFTLYILYTLILYLGNLSKTF